MHKFFSRIGVKTDTQRSSLRIGDPSIKTSLRQSVYQPSTDKFKQSWEVFSFQKGLDDNKGTEITESDRFSGGSQHIYTFHVKADLQPWRVVTDHDIGGKSTGSIRIGEEGQLIFEGRVSEQLPDKAEQEVSMNRSIKRSGYVGMVTDELLQLNGYDAIVFRVKTDGFLYLAQLKARRLSVVTGGDNEFVGCFYQHAFGPKPSSTWTNITLPLNKFYQTSFKGQKNSVQIPLTHALSTDAGPAECAEIIGMGIVLSSQHGPFRFELESIRAAKLSQQNMKKRYTAVSTPDDM